jgi:hypothetical protein
MVRPSTNFISTILFDLNTDNDQVPGWLYLIQGGNGFVWSSLTVQTSMNSVGGLEAVTDLNFRVKY